MTAMTDFIMARSTVAAGRFFAVSDQVTLEGTYREEVAEDTYLVHIKEGYQPDPHWEELVFDLYVALSTEAEEYANKYYDDEESYPWRYAMDQEIFEPHGWAHRIVNVINYYRKLNGVHPGAGDIEHNLMVEAIRKRVEV